MLLPIKQNPEVPSGLNMIYGAVVPGGQLKTAPAEGKIVKTAYTKIKSIKAQKITLLFMLKRGRFYLKTYLADGKQAKIGNS